MSSVRRLDGRAPAAPDRSRRSTSSSSRERRVGACRRSSTSMAGVAPSARSSVTQLVGEATFRDDHLHLAVVEDERAARRGRLGIDRHVAGAGLEDAEDRRHGVDRLVQAEADAIAGPHAHVPQPVAQPVGQRVQLAVGERRGRLARRRRRAPDCDCADSVSNDARPCVVVITTAPPSSISPAARCSRSRPGWRTRGRSLRARSRIAPRGTPPASASTTSRECRSP